MNKLKKETNKWQKKLENKIKELEETNEEGKNFLKNIKAYYKDSFHFEEEEDYLRAFESIIWAWAWFEIGKEYGFIKISP